MIAVAQLSDLVRPDGPLRRGVGHLLRFDPERHEVDGLSIVGVAARVATLNASLIIVGDFDQYTGELADELVEHQPPPSLEIFRSQLRHRLGRRCLGDCSPCNGVCITDYLNREVVNQPPLRAYLTGTHRPTELVPLVEMIAETTPRGPSLDELLSRVLPGQLRQRAKTILAPGEAEVRAAEMVDAHQLRAFRLACAVLDGQPISDIWRAACRLSRPPAQTHWTEAAGPRQPDLELLLGDSLRQAVTLTGDRYGAPAKRILRFAVDHEQLRAYLLDVAWTEWWSSDQLLRWLTDLVRTETPGIRQAAAGAIGRSAKSEIAPVLAVANELSQHQRPGIRQAASIVLVAVAMQPLLRRRIRDEIERWASGPTRQRDTVARAYALGLAQIWPETAMNHLRRAAQARMQRWNNSVVRGVLGVYRSGSPVLAITALVDWAYAADREVRLHAARTLRVLADRRSAPPRSHWPELLELVRTGTLPMADLAALWRVALSLPGTAYRCWRTLGFWIAQAEKDPELSDLCLELLRHTVVDQPLRRRLDHHVRQIWPPIMPQSTFLLRVARLTIAN